MIGTSPQMLRVYEAIAAVGATSIPVLIVGETGSGKELVANAIYEQSGYQKVLIPINCAVIPESLAESELFGHMRGAFTGASTKRVGKLEAARSGTVFLDDIRRAEPEYPGKTFAGTPAPRDNSPWKQLRRRG